MCVQMCKHFACFPRFLGQGKHAAFVIPNTFVYLEYWGNTGFKKWEAGLFSPHYQQKKEIGNSFLLWNV